MDEVKGPEKVDTGEQERTRVTGAPYSVDYMNPDRKNRLAQAQSSLQRNFAGYGTDSRGITKTQYEEAERYFAQTITEQPPGT